MLFPYRWLKVNATQCGDVNLSLCWNRGEGKCTYVLCLRKMQSILILHNKYNYEPAMILMHIMSELLCFLKSNYNLCILSYVFPHTLQFNVSLPECWYQQHIAYVLLS